MMKAEVKFWLNKLESVKAQDDSGLLVLIGSDFTQFGSQLRLPGEPTTRKIRYEIDGDRILLGSVEGRVMGGGVLSPDERRVSSPTFVEFSDPLGTLVIPGLGDALKAGKNLVLDASFEEADKV